MRGGDERRGPASAAIDLPDETSLEAAAESLERAGFAAERGGGAGGGAEVRTRDPWATAVRLRAKAPAADLVTRGAQRGRRSQR